MQSSAAVAGRALIMLACVVGIPVVALSDVSWSGVLEKLQNFQWPAILSSTSPPTLPLATASSDQPPLFSPSDVAETSPTAPNLLGPISPTPTALPIQALVVPVGFQFPVESPPAMPPAVHVAPIAPKNAPGEIDFSADPFVSIQNRLRQLGATYYLLESWGNDRQMYRFYCKMAIGGSAAYTRCFEATDANPLQAMRQVLRQIENGGGKVEGGNTSGEWPAFSSSSLVPHSSNP